VARRDPPGFLFAVKGSRFLTHMKKLKDPEPGLRRFFEPLSDLGDKLGPDVFQLPPRWRADAGRLAAFLEVLPKGPRYAFEFRDESWFASEIGRLLERFDAALCLYDLAGRQAPLWVTADFTYIRLHGPGGPYQGRYGEGAPPAGRRGCATGGRPGSPPTATSTTTQRGTRRVTRCGSPA
jgi:uncharacterized protein YecE (DUF72 family)